MAIADITTDLQRGPALGGVAEGSAGIAGGRATEGLPFLTVLAPSERWSSERGRRHKTVVDWAELAKKVPSAKPMEG